MLALGRMQSRFKSVIVAVVSEAGVGTKELSCSELVECIEVSSRKVMGALVLERVVL